MSESLRHLCVPPCVRCVHCVPSLPLYVFHCAKIDSVLTQPTQGKKRIVGARLNAWFIHPELILTEDSVYQIWFPDQNYMNINKLLFKNNYILQSRALKMQGLLALKNSSKNLHYVEGLMSLFVFHF